MSTLGGMYGMLDIPTSILPKEINPNRAWKVTTDPLIEPITVTELKNYARIDGNQEDSILSSIIKGTRLLVENYINRALIEQTITMQMDFWPSNQIELPRPPLISITSIQMLDEDGIAITYSSSNYYTITNATPGRLIIKNSTSFPRNLDRYYGGHQIIYTAGYGSTATYIPDAIKEGMKAWATMIYDSRVNSDEPPPIAARLLSFYKVMNI
jgi:uncharacterized phiE125 gp8 family phage protein